MKPATADALAHAKIHLDEANKVFAIGLIGLAGRQAYLAALTAARGLVFEYKGTGPKTHRGTRALMHQLTREGVPLSPDLLLIFKRASR